MAPTGRPSQVSRTGAHLVLAGRFFAGLVVLALSACSATRGPCHGSTCACTNGTDCAFECNLPGCDGTCQSVDSCSGTCLDDCNVGCDSVSTCDVSCGDACTVDCQSLSTCTVECGADCRVSCGNASTCAIRMVSGTASCTSVGSCQVRCVLPDGSEQDAMDCGGGVWGCGACSAP